MNMLFFFTGGMVIAYIVVRMIVRLLNTKTVELYFDNGEVTMSGKDLTKPAFEIEQEIKTLGFPRGRYYINCNFEEGKVQLRVVNFTPTGEVAPKIPLASLEELQKLFLRYNAVE